MDKIKMPKYLNTPDEEFCRYLWLENPDPVVTRLLNMVDDLVAWRSIAEEPDDVLETLRNNENEIDNLTDAVREYQQRIAELEARTIIDMMNELEEKLQEQVRVNRRLNDSVNAAYDDVAEAKTREAAALKKLDMWAILNR